jgi:PLD-like domain
MHRMAKAVVVLGCLCCALPTLAQAQERLCDPELEDCRAPILNLIRNERQGIDVGFWEMSDSRYSAAIIQRFTEGVPVRLLMDPRVVKSHPSTAAIIQQFKDAGIPMRSKVNTGIFHWKMMLFHGQNVVEFSKGNYIPYAYVPTTPGVDWFDEAVYFSDDSALTNTFRSKFDDLWTNTTTYANYANITGPLVRRYPAFPQVSWMNFPPTQDFAARTIGRFNREMQKMDVIIFRNNDRRYADAILNAVKRGVPVRLIHEPQTYRSRSYIWHSYNIDRLHMAGVQVKSRVHQGLLHEMAVVLYGLGEVIFGSSNFTTPSSNSQAEHNVFYSPSVNKPWFYQWFVDHFERKWNNAAGFLPFQPLPPDAPVLKAPANGAAGLSSSVTLKWDGREFAHKYDIHFGTSSSPPLWKSNVVVGVPGFVGNPVTGKIESITVQTLPGTRYYWRIVSKTMANKTKTGPTWSFTTAGTSGG